MEWNREHSMVAARHARGTEASVGQAFEATLFLPELQAPCVLVTLLPTKCCFMLRLPSSSLVGTRVLSAVSMKVVPAYLFSSST